MNWRSLIQADLNWSSRLRLRHERSLRFKLAAFLAHSGDSWFWLVGLFIVWLFAGLAWKQRSVLMALGVLGLAVTVLLIKFSVRRRRPEGEWGAIYRNTDPHSFPSGHAARAAMLAIVGLGLGPLWLGLLLLVWAPLVSLARVIVGVHYVSEVLAGLVIGLLAGVLILFIGPYILTIFPWLVY